MDEWDPYPNYSRQAQKLDEGDQADQAQTNHETTGIPIPTNINAIMWSVWELIHESTDSTR